MTRVVVVGVAVVAVVVTVAVGALCAACPKSGEPEDEGEVKGAVLVETATVVRGDVEETIEAYGIAEPAPDSTVPVSFDLDAAVVRVLARAGQIVKAGDALVEVRASQAVRLDAERSKIDVDVAQRELARVTAQRDKGFATNADVAQADAALRKAQAELSALAAVGAGGVHTVRAPSSGLVRDVLVKPGDVVPPGAPLVVLAAAPSTKVAAAPTTSKSAPASSSISAQRVKLGLEAKDVARVHDGAVVHVIAIYDAGAIADGIVVQVHPQIDVDTHQAAVVVALDGAPFVVGSMVRGRIVVRAETGALVVPRKALASTSAAGPRAVYVVDKEKAKRVDVDVLTSDGPRVAVKPIADGALAENALVVTVGASELEDGAAVRLHDDDKKDADDKGGAQKDGAKDGAKEGAKDGAKDGDDKKDGAKSDDAKKDGAK